MWGLESRLQLKSRALFIHAFGGAVDVHLRMFDADTSLFTAKLTDPLYKHIRFDKENPLLLLRRDQEPPTVQPYAQYADARVNGESGIHVSDGTVCDVWWCNRRIGGTFRRKEMWLWSIEPHAACKPQWWEDEDWIARVIGQMPHVRDLLIPPRP